MYIFQIVNNKDIPWEVLDNCYDQTVFKTKGWSLFLKESFGVDPFLVEIHNKKEALIGYFYGQQISKFGVKIIASPFEGWSTSFQGLSMLQKIDKNTRLDIYEELADWLLKNGYCSFLQISDYQLDVAECIHHELNFELSSGYILDLNQSEDDIYKNMSSRAKDPLKKSIKRGVSVKSCSDINKYADEYYNQLKNVFKVQGLKPTHSKNETVSMLSNLYPNNILALYAVDGDGRPIASSFYVYQGKYAFYAGAASYKEDQHLCPNEPIMWKAIKILKSKGVQFLEFGGGRRYKEKYGPSAYVKPQLIFAKHNYIYLLKNTAKKAYYKIRETLATLRGKKVNKGENKN